MISFIFKHVFALDLDRAWLLAECQLASPVPAVKYQAAACVSIPPLNGYLTHLPAAPPEVTASYYTGRAHCRYYGGEKSGLFLAGYVTEGNTECEAEQKAIQAAAWFAKTAQWEGVDG